MADVVCSKCGKLDDTVVCEKCFKDSEYDNEQLSKDNSDLVDELNDARKQIQELKGRLKECEQCKACEALHKVGGDVT